MAREHTHELVRNLMKHFAHVPLVILAMLAMLAMLAILAILQNATQRISAAEPTRLWPEETSLACGCDVCCSKSAPVFSSSPGTSLSSSED